MVSVKRLDSWFPRAQLSVHNHVKEHILRSVTFGNVGRYVMKRKQKNVPCVIFPNFVVKKCYFCKLEALSHLNR